MTAPVILFAYRRPLHLARTLAALAANRGAADTDLFVFCDGPAGNDDADPVAAVRRTLRDIAGFKSVTVNESTAHRGLADSVIAGVSAVLRERETAIVLEDDLETAPDFLAYMNEALDFYRDEPRIFSISAYTPPVALPPDPATDLFFLPRASSWGWGIWRDRWERIDWEVGDRVLLDDPAVRDAFDRVGTDLSDMLERWLAGTVDSWAIRFNWAHFRNDALSVVPRRSRTRSIGCDGSGSNLGRTDRYAVALAEGTGPLRFPADITLDPRILAAYRRFFGRSWRRRLKHWVRLMTRFDPF